MSEQEAPRGDGKVWGASAIGTGRVGSAQVLKRTAKTVVLAERVAAFGHLKVVSPDFCFESETDAWIYVLGSIARDIGMLQARLERRRKDLESAQQQLAAVKSKVTRNPG